MRGLKGIILGVSVCVVSACGVREAQSGMESVSELVSSDVAPKCSTPTDCGPEQVCTGYRLATGLERRCSPKETPCSVLKCGVRECWCLLSDPMICGC